MVSSVEESRHSFRIKENTPIKWKMDIPGANLRGEGMIHDISAGGLSLEIHIDHDDFKNEPNSYIYIESVEPEADYLPELAQMVWSRAMKTNIGYSLAGAKFVNLDEAQENKIKKHMKNRFLEIAEAANINILENFNLGRTGSL